MSSLPRDSAADILAALSVKDLIRFRCVSSSICSLIDSPYFTKLHLSRSEKTRSGYIFIYRTLEEIKSLRFDSLVNGPEIYPPSILPQSNPCNYTRIVASCNGVVVLLTGIEVPSLWNPFTRQFRQLPCCEITHILPEHFKPSMMYGLGYDYETDDYKLVHFAHFTAISFPNASGISKAAVFSLKSYSWREIECPPSVSLDNIVIMERGAFVNNALHWARYEQMGPKILGFNLVKEEFYLLPHPDFSLGYQMMVVLGGCLSVVDNIPGDAASLDVWVMKDYGVKESWSKLLFIPNSRDMECDYQSHVIPTAYSRDGKKILMNHECHLSWYDSTTETLNTVDVVDTRGRPFTFYALPFDHTLFMESLVALD